MALPIVRGLRDLLHTVNADDIVTVDPRSVTFTPEDWHRAQTVKVTAKHDADAADYDITITHAVASADPRYRDAMIDSVIVRVGDDDQPTSTADRVQSACSVEDAVALGQRVVGSINSGDSFWLAVRVASWTWLNVFLTGVSHNGEPALDEPDVAGYKRIDGPQTTTFARGLLHEGRIWHPAFFYKPGVVCFEVKSQSGAAGSFEVTVERNEDPLLGGAPNGHTSDYSADIDTSGEAARIGSPHSRAGYLGDHNEPGADEDWFRVTLNANEEYRISVIPDHRVEQRHQLSSPTITGIYDAGGSAVGTVTGSKSTVLFTSQGAGVHYIGIAGSPQDRDGHFRLCIHKSDEASNICRNNPETTATMKVTVSTTSCAPADHARYTRLLTGPSADDLELRKPGKLSCRASVASGNSLPAGKNAPTGSDTSGARSLRNRKAERLVAPPTHASTTA